MGRGYNYSPRTEKGLKSPIIKESGIMPARRQAATDRQQTSEKPPPLILDGSENADSTDDDSAAPVVVSTSVSRQQAAGRSENAKRKAPAERQGENVNRKREAVKSQLLSPSTTDNI